MTEYLIDDMPFEERPRERCLAHGPDCLSFRECLGLILGGGPSGRGCLGVADELISKTGGDEAQPVGFFSAMEMTEGAVLSGTAGLGAAGQARVQAVFEFARRYWAYRNVETVGIQKKDDLDLAEYVPEVWRRENREWLGFIPVLGVGRIGTFQLAQLGARVSVNIEPVELFSRILAFRPKGVALFHNHPSGFLQPSDHDILLTKHVARAAKTIGISFLGHCIVGPRGWHWIVL
jgi:DNA repair protein RadC